MPGTRVGDPVVFLDLDNTLYNWVDFFAPAFRAMVHALSRELSVNEATLTNQFRKVYMKHESIEYSYSIEELDSVLELPREEIVRLARLGWSAYNSVAKKRLRLYPGVNETLRWLRDSEACLVGMTNGPLYLTLHRLHALQVDEFFQGLSGWTGWEVPQVEHRFDPYGRAPVGYRQWRGLIKHRWPRPKDRLKPNPAAYSDILRLLGKPAEGAWAVGDSLQKDIAPALRLGLKGVWARYGTQYDAKNMQTLLQVTHWGAPTIAMTYQPDGITPDWTIDDFSRLRTLIPTSPKQTRLRDFAVG